MKTKSPIWEKTFHFDINDAFSILKISVASEKMNSPLVRHLNQNSDALKLKIAIEEILSYAV